MYFCMDLVTQPYEIEFLECDPESVENRRTRRKVMQRFGIRCLSLKRKNCRRKMNG